MIAEEFDMFERYIAKKREKEKLEKASPKEASKKS